MNTVTKKEMGKWQQPKRSSSWTMRSACYHSKKWERVFTETDSGTQSREGAASARGDGQGVEITVTDGLSYDWNETAGVVRVAITVMTIGIPDGAQAPTPQARATGGGGGCAASAVAPLALLLIVPLLLTGKRRS